MLAKDIKKSSQFLKEKRQKTSDNLQNKIIIALNLIAIIYFLGHLIAYYLNY